MDPTTVLWIGGALVLFLIAIGLVITFGSQRSAEEERLGEYVEVKETRQDKKADRNMPVTDWLSSGWKSLPMVTGYPKILPRLT